MSRRLELLHQLLESTPGDAFTLFAIAKEYENLGDPEQALAYYQRLREADPAYVGLYYHLGKLLETLNRPDAAIEAYRSGMRLARAAGDMHAWSELSGARLAIDDSDDE